MKKMKKECLITDLFLEDFEAAFLIVFVFNQEYKKWKTKLIRFKVKVKGYFSKLILNPTLW